MNFQCDYACLSIILISAENQDVLNTLIGEDTTSIKGRYITFLANIYAIILLKQF